MVREGNKELCHFLSASACPLLGSAFMVRIQKSVFVKPALTKICCAENEHTEYGALSPGVVQWVGCAPSTHKALVSAGWRWCTPLVLALRRQK